MSAALNAVTIKLQEDSPRGNTLAGSGGVGGWGIGGRAAPRCRWSYGGWTGRAGGRSWQRRMGLGARRGGESGPPGGTRGAGRARPTYRRRPRPKAGAFPVVEVVAARTFENQMILGYCVVAVGAFLEVGGLAW